MRTIWKYVLPRAREDEKKALKHVVKMPVGGKVLSVIEQRQVSKDWEPYKLIVTYVEVETTAQEIEHVFYVTGTGYDNSEIDKVAHFVGTVNTDDGWMHHIFHKQYGK